MSKSTIMVTGSSGTVGSALAIELRRRNYEIIPLDIKPNLWDGTIERRTLRHDLRKPLENLRLRRDPELVIHLAANARVHDLVVNPGLALDNYVMTHNILEFARKRGIKQLVFSSSREVYGESRSGVKRKEGETRVTDIKSPYTASKLSSEALIHAYRHCYDIDPVIVRLSNVYGRYDISERVIPLFIYYARRNRPITVFGREKKLDFTFIDDVTDGLVKIIQHYRSVAGLTLNLSSGRGVKLVDLARKVVDQLGSDSPISTVVKRVGEISSFVGDISLACTQLGYKPKVFIEQGLRRNIDWYCEVTAERRILEIQRRNLARRGWA